jgi:hypothetical protein
VNVEMSIMPPEPPQQHGDAELMLNHSIDFGLVEVHAPRLNPIKRVPPSQLRD